MIGSAVSVEERVDSLKKRSIKKQSKLWALDLAIRMMNGIGKFAGGLVSL